MSRREGCSECGDHHRAFSAALQQARRDGQLCDVWLRCGGQLLSAHRLVLAIHSPYFDALFRWLPHKKHYDFQTPTPEELSSVLDFIYTGETELNYDNVFPILDTAEFLGIPLLKSYCEEFLLTAVEADPCRALQVQYAAALYELEELFSTASELINVKLADIWHESNSGWLQLPAARVHHALKSHTLSIKEERQVYDAVLSWLKHHPNIVPHEIELVLSAVRLPLMRSEHLLAAKSDLLLHGDAVSPAAAQLLMSGVQEALEWQMRPLEQPYKQSLSTTPRYREARSVVYAISTDQGRSRVARQFMGYIPHQDRWFCLRPPDECGDMVWTAAVLMGLLYVNFASQDGEGCTPFYTYDISENSWRCLAALPSSCLCRRLLATRQHLLAICLAEDAEHCGFYSYEPDIDEWSFGTVPLPPNYQDLQWDSGFAAGPDRVYAIGGSAEWYSHKAVWCYESEAGWQRVCNMPLILPATSHEKCEGRRDNWQVLVSGDERVIVLNCDFIGGGKIAEYNASRNSWRTEEWIYSARQRQNFPLQVQRSIQRNQPLRFVRMDMDGTTCYNDASSSVYLSQRHATGNVERKLFYRYHLRTKEWTECEPLPNIPFHLLVA